MSPLQKLAVFAGALAVAAAPTLTGCGDDAQTKPDSSVGPLPGTDGAPTDGSIPPTDGPVVSPDGGDGGGEGGPDGGAPELFTDFVKRLITNDTKPDSLPTPINGKTFLPDPEDPRAFPPAFF